MSATLQRDGVRCSDEALPSDLRVFVPTKNGIVYPDATILCGERLLRDGSADVLRNPTDGSTHV